MSWLETQCECGQHLPEHGIPWAMHAMDCPKAKATMERAGVRFKKVEGGYEVSARTPMPTPVAVTLGVGIFVAFPSLVGYWAYTHFNQPLLVSVLYGFVACALLVGIAESTRN